MFQKTQKTQKVETLIVGAGVIGSSVAMHLAQMGMTDVRVIDFDLEGSLSSSELNAGGVRATWIHPINIEMSKLTIDYFASIAEQVGYRSCGYLWLHSPEKFQVALSARERQVSQGWPVEVWDIPALQKKVPFIDKTNGIAGAIFAPRDGLVNPNLLKNHYRSEAKKLGVIFDDHTWLREVQYSQSATHKIQILADQIQGEMRPDIKAKLAQFEYDGIAKTSINYQANRIVNCAGPWASQIAKLIGYKSPAVPVRRQICIFDCRDIDLTPYGMIIDTSGVYFHPEAMNGLAGFANHNEPQGINFQYDGDSFFQEVIWPALYERSSAFERLRHLTGWAGLYEVSPDESAIIGQVESSTALKAAEVYEAHSFSGHGVMHSYSAGKALAEKIIKGRYETIDLSALSGARFDQGKFVREEMII